MRRGIDSLMENSRDIYSKDKKKKDSPWKRGHHHHKPIVEPESRQEGHVKAEKPRDGSKRSSSRRKLRRQRNRRLMLTLGLLALLGYIGYTGIVALRGVMRHGGIAAEDLSWRVLLGLEASEPTAAGESVLRAQPKLDGFDAAAMIETIDRSRSLEMDVRNLLDKGLTAQALKRVQNAQEAWLSSIKLRQMIADAFMQEKRFVEAIEVLEENLALEPDNGKARLQMAKALFSLGDYDAAISVADWALRGNFDGYKAHRIMADSYAEMGMNSESISEYRKMISLNPNDDEVRSKLAMAYYENGEYGRAVNLLNELIENGTDNSLAYYNLAICYAKQSLVDETVQTLMRATRQFGNKFVRAWILGEEFDGIRNEIKFIMFANNLDLGPDVADMRAQERDSQRTLDLGRSPLQFDDRTESMLNRER